MAGPDEDPKKEVRKSPKLRPDLPGGRGRTKEERQVAADRAAMVGRSDDRKIKEQKGETGRKKRKRGDQGAWN